MIFTTRVRRGTGALRAGAEEGVVLKSWMRDERARTCPAPTPRRSCCSSDVRLVLARKGLDWAGMEAKQE